MHNHFNVRSGLKAPLIADDVYEIIMKVRVCLLCIILGMIISCSNCNSLSCLYFCLFRMLLAWIVRSYMTETLTLTILVLKLLRGHTFSRFKIKLLRGLSIC